jgi:hypothetical protein
MQISILNNYKPISINNNIKHNNIPKLQSLKADTVSFTGEEKVNKKNQINAIKSEISKLNTKSKTYTQDILNVVGIKYKTNEKGKLILEKYDQPFGYTFSDIGVDENRLFKDIVEIEKTANFSNTNATNLGNLEFISGIGLADGSYIAVNFNGSNITDTGNLIYIGGEPIFDNSKLTNLEKIKYIDGDVSFENSKITNLGDLVQIEGNANFNNSKIRNLVNLERIIGNATVANSKIESLGILKSIEGDADFRYTSKLKNLGNLKHIGGNADFTFSQIENIVNLEHIEKNAYINKVNIPKNFYNINYIGGELYYI